MSLADLSKVVGPRFGSFVYAACRGEDGSEVVRRREAKTLLAAKSFTPTSSLDIACSWLKVLAEELVERLSYEQEHHSRHASTLTCSFRLYNVQSKGAVSLSRSATMPSESVKSRAAAIVEIAKSILQRISTGKENKFPISFCGLTGSNFQKRASGSHSIIQFCKPSRLGEEHSLPPRTSIRSVVPGNSPCSRKRKRENIGQYFSKELRTASSTAIRTATSRTEAVSVGEAERVTRREQIRNDLALARLLKKEEWSKGKLV